MEPSMKRVIALILAVAGVALAWRSTDAQQQTSIATAPAKAPVVVGTLVLQTDAPAPGAAVAPPFGVSGWALDQAASSGTGVDAGDVWAFPGSRGPVLRGAAAAG